MAHEDFSRNETVEGSSDRSFGIVFTVVFALVGLWPLWSGATPRLWALGCAAAILAIALAAPAWLAAPNRGWTKLGVLLGRVVAPLAAAVLFFAVFTPFGLVRRLFVRDPLRLRFDPAAHTYWVERSPTDAERTTMKNQF